MQKGYRSVNDKNVAITDPLFAHYVDMIADAVSAVSVGSPE